MQEGVQEGKEQEENKVENKNSKELTEEQKALIPANVLEKLTNAVNFVDQQYGHRLQKSVQFADV